MQLGSTDGGEGGGFWHSGHCYVYTSGQLLCIEASMNILGYRICDKEQ